jgi:hypothetical protein
MVVQNKPTAAPLNTPLIKLIASAAGEEIDGEVVDTAELSSSGRTIVGIIDATARGMDPAGFLV